MKRAATLAFLALVLATAGAAIFLSQAPDNTPQAVASPIDEAERARAIQALRPKSAARPVIAILAQNAGTEIADLLNPYGVLRQADVADVVVVAEHKAPLRLYPGDLRAMPDASFDEFAHRYPRGADIVVVPAMDPYDDHAAIDWLLAQRQSGARIVSVCNGSLTLGAAGLLDGRSATSHWSTVGELESRHPSMRRVQNRRYVTDGDITTATGITASLPLMLALVEAIGGQDAAAKTAAELGIDHWDARHVSNAFTLNNAHRWTFLRNKLQFWAQQEREVAVQGADEIALGIAVDAYSRTERVSVVSVADAPEVRSKRGLLLLPGRVGDVSALPHPVALPMERPGGTPQQVLARIESEFDPRTARYVALTLEYPWSRSPGKRSATGN
ncbi:MAG TPA: DJ-1/PfpI family protein [Luteimonas sp.]|nr:DJ-1/PfpI family protein [Luteimonas sp.]